MLRYNGTSVPREYEAQVQLAIWTFRHQLVFDPASRRLVHLNPLPAGGLANDVAQLPPATQLDPENLEFLGPALPDDIAAGIAAGNLNPHTRRPYEEVAPVVREQLTAQQDRGGAAGHPAGRWAGSAPAQRNGIKSYFSAMAAAEPAAAGTGAMTAKISGPRHVSAGRPTAVRTGRQPRAAQLAALQARGYSSQPEYSGGTPRIYVATERIHPHQYIWSPMARGDALTTVRIRGHACFNCVEAAFLSPQRIGCRRARRLKRDGLSPPLSARRPHGRRARSRRR